MGGIRGGIRALRGVRALKRVGISRKIGISEEIKALLLPTFNLLAGPWRLASSFYSLVGLAKGLSQKLHQTQDFGAIVIKIWSLFF